MARTYYRIVRHPAALEDDFKPAKELGKPLRDPRFERQWSEGVSVYDTFESAAERARRYRYRLGRFIVAITLPAGAKVEVEQSGNDPRHYTLYADPQQLLSLADDSPRRVAEEEGR